ncbi:MAG: hypothetical protein RTV31_11145 [Candidatus Thorarchaeota archaeon]
MFNMMQILERYLMSAAQIPPLIINYGSVPLIIFGWTILCGVIYYGVRFRSKESKSQDYPTLFKMGIFIYILWIIPTLILIVIVDFIILMSVNPISLVVIILFILISFDLMKIYRKGS